MTEEFAAKVTYLDGAVQHAHANDRAHAELIAEGINEHVASLNEATRLVNGIEGAEVVHRAVRKESDGATWLGPWVPAARQLAAAHTFVLSDDQLDAIRVLLALVHYDDLALSWLDMLPEEFRPQFGGGAR